MAKIGTPFSFNHVFTTKMPRLLPLLQGVNGFGETRTNVRENPDEATAQSQVKPDIPVN
jgi:hypothetical protein